MLSPANESPEDQDLRLELQLRQERAVERKIDGFVKAYKKNFNAGSGRGWRNLLGLDSYNDNLNEDTKKELDEICPGEAYLTNDAALYLGHKQAGLSAGYSDSFSWPPKKLREDNYNRHCAKCVIEFMARKEQQPEQS